MSKLRKSKSNKIIAGVCGGIGEYLNIDPVIIRIIWVILTFAPGFPGLLAYIICALIIPEDSGVVYEENSSSYNREKLPLVLGIGLIIIGSALLIDIMFPKFFHMFNIMRVLRYWPALLIIAGILIIVKNRSK